MAARHFAEDFSEEQGNDLESPYASNAQGKHLRQPVVEYVPAYSADAHDHPVTEDDLANERARKYVEEIFRELTDPVIPTKDEELVQPAPRDVMALKSSGVLDTLPDFGPPQSKLSEFVPSVEVVPHNWNEPVREGVFARNKRVNVPAVQPQPERQDPSTTVVLDQSKLHGLRRRHESMKYGQIQLVRGPNRLEPSHADQSFGYFNPTGVPQLREETSLSLPARHKGLLAAIAGFIAGLFGRFHH